MFNYLIKDKRGSCIIAGLIILVVLVVAIGGGAIWLLNQTPDSLGVADVEFADGMSFRSLDLADTKVKDLYKQFKELAYADNSKVVQNAPTDEDKTSADDSVGGNLPETESGEPDYASLVTNPVYYDKEYVIDYKDTTLAYVFNKIVAQSTDGAASSGADESSIEFIKSINATINEITLTEADGKVNCRTVLSINSSSLKGQLKAELGSLAGMLPIPDVIYLVSYLELSANAEGELTPTSVNLKINDTENALSKAIFKVMSKMVQESTEDTGVNVSDDDAANSRVVNDKIGEAMALAVKNLGRVGTATKTSETDNSAVTGTVVLGDAGLSAGKLTVITNVNPE